MLWGDKGDMVFAVDFIGSCRDFMFYCFLLYAGRLRFVRDVSARGEAEGLNVDRCHRTCCGVQRAFHSPLELYGSVSRQKLS